MSKALSGFRQLLKSSRYVFSGDSRAVAAARVQLRDEFLKNKDVSDAATLNDLYKGIQEVDEMLRFNIVQGERNERGNYGVKLTTENKVTTLARLESTHLKSILWLKHIRESNENSILVPSPTLTLTLPVTLSLWPSISFAHAGEHGRGEQAASRERLRAHRPELRSGSHGGARQGQEGPL